MKVAVIGATGFVGSTIANELANRNIKVTGISRQVKTTYSKLIDYIAVDVTNTQRLADVLKGHDVVISAFSPLINNPNLTEDFIAGSSAVTQAVKQAGVKRFILIGGAGSLLTANGEAIIDTLPEDLPFVPKAKATKAYFEIFKQEKELDWAYFSPALEMNPSITIGRTGKYRLGTDYPVFDETGKNVLSVEDLAVVIADEVEHPKHHQIRFTAAY